MLRRWMQILEGGGADRLTPRKWNTFLLDQSGQQPRSFLAAPSRTGGLLRRLLKLAKRSKNVGETSERLPPDADTMAEVGQYMKGN